MALFPAFPGKELCQEKSLRSLAERIASGPMRLSRVLAVLMAFLSGAVPGFAQEGAAAKLEVLDAQQAGLILEKVLKLTTGRPAEVIWGKVTGSGAQLPAWSGVVRQPDLVLEGNAWLIRKGEGGAAEVVDADFRVRRFQPGLPKGDVIKGVEVGEWVPVSSGADEGRIAAWLEKLSAAAGSSRLREEAQEQQHAARARLLCWLAMAHAAGSAKAPDITTALLDVASSREKILDALMATAAEAAVTGAAQEALRSGDWKAYRSALEAVMSRYTRGWENRPAVESWLKVRQPGWTEEKPWLDGVENLTAEQKAQALTIFESVLKLESRLPAVPWLLPAPRRMETQDKATAEALETLRQGGRTLMPAWIALLEDESLVRTWAPVQKPPGENERASGRLASAEDEPPVEPWQGLWRPAMRREIAASILAGVLPEAQLKPWRKMATPSKAASMWWSTYGAMPEAALALNFAQYGRGAMQLRGIGMVVESGDERALVSLEKELLSQARTHSRSFELPAHREYVRLRGKAAAGFTEKLLPAVRANLEQQYLTGLDEDQRSSYQPQLETWLKEFGEQMKSMMEQRAAPEVVAEFLSGKLPPAQAAGALELALMRLPFDEAALLVLESVVAAPRDFQIWILLGSLGSPQVASGADRAGRIAALAARKELIEKFLTGAVASPPSRMDRNRFVVRAASYLEFIISGGNNDGWHSLGGLAGVAESPELAATAAARIRALIDGVPPVAYPTAEDADSGKLHALWQTFESMEPDAVAAGLEALKPQELLALEALGADWPEPVAAVANRIQRVVFYGDRVETLAALQGRTLDAAVVQVLLDQGYEAAKAGRIMDVRLQRESLKGFLLQVEQTSSPEQAKSIAGYLRLAMEGDAEARDRKNPWLAVTWNGSSNVIGSWWGPQAPVFSAEPEELPDEEEEDDEDDDKVGPAETPPAGEAAQKTAAAPTPAELRDKAWLRLNHGLVNDLDAAQRLNGLDTELSLTAGPGSALPDQPTALDHTFKAHLSQSYR